MEDKIYQVCRYVAKGFGASKSPNSIRQRGSHQGSVVQCYSTWRPALLGSPCTLIVISIFTFWLMGSGRDALADPLINYDLNNDTLINISDARKLVKLFSESC